MPFRTLIVAWSTVVALFPAGVSASRLYLVPQVNRQLPIQVQRSDLLRGDRLRLHLVVARGRSGRVRYYGGFAGAAIIAGRRVAVRRWAGAAPQIRWLKVEPLMRHERKGNDPTVPDFLWYTNAHVPESPKSGWLGFDKIRYRETPITHKGSAWTITPDVAPTDRRFSHRVGLGVMRFAATITIGQETLRTTGKEATDYLGVRASVYTLVVREDNSLVGWATSYFNVPGIYGSAPRQVDRHLGVDCADLIVGALRRWRRRREPYTNVNGLVKRFRKLSGVVYLTKSGKIFHDEALTRRAQIRVKRGDIVAFDYPGTPKKRWDHVGIVYRTRNGMLAGADLILHAGPAEAQITPLTSDGFVGDSATRIIVLRATR